MKIRLIFGALSILLLGACKDDGEVGSLIQPEEDLLHVYSNMVNVESSSVLTDSVLSKSEYLFLGEYNDLRFGGTQAEFISQIDSRIDGLTIPDTTVVSTSSSVSGILSNLLNQFDSNYGNVLSIFSPTNIQADSVFFLIQYADEFFGDSTSLQAVDIYALNKTLNNSQVYYTNAKISDFCNKDTLLGSHSYQIQNSRQIKVPLDDEFGERLVKVYEKGSSIKTQAQFNEFFKGIYASHSFNEGGIVKVNVAGILLYYSYDAKIKTTYNGKDTIVNSTELKNSDGSRFNPLVSSVFLSANKAVERVNLIKHNGLKENFPLLQNQNVTYTFTPSGLYTSVKIPLDIIVDSVKQHASDTTKVMFNSARLKLYTEKLDWDTKLSKTPNSYMLLLHKDSVVPFFYKNKSPNGYTSFVATYDTTGFYAFDLTKAIQKRYSGREVSFSDEMVLVPVQIVESNSVYYYRQQLWITATMFYGLQSTDVNKRPRIDLIYTRRE